MLHAVGNSQCCFFTGTDHLQGYSWFQRKPPETIPNIKVYPLGQPTAWQFADEYIPWIRRLPIPAGGKLLLVFGEIDCRWQIPNRIFKLSDAPKAIADCQKRFFDGVLTLRYEYRPAVWCVHYTTRKIESVNLVSNSAMFRGAIVKMWNEMAKERCDELGVPFFDISRKMVLDDGLADDSYLLDDIHLNQKAMPLALEALGGWQNE